MGAALPLITHNGAFAHFLRPEDHPKAVSDW
jgi:hypothetical protein